MRAALVAALALPLALALVWLLGRTPLGRHIDARLQSLVWKLLPAAWRPVAQTPAPTPTPVPTPTPTPGPDSRCPDGECDESCARVSAADVAAYRRWHKVCAVIPILGPLAASIYGLLVKDPVQEAVRTLEDAAGLVREANSLWQDAYVRFLHRLAPEVKRAAEEALAPHGYAATLAQYASAPLVHSAGLLVPPVLGLLLCSAVLVWAI